MKSIIVDWSKYMLAGCQEIRLTQFDTWMDDSVRELIREHNISVFVIHSHNARKFVETKDFSFASTSYKNGPIRIHVIYEDMINCAEDEFNFILLHEIGHIVNKTDEEEVCDRFAMKYFPNNPYDVYHRVLLRIYRYNPVTKNFDHLPEGVYGFRLSHLMIAKQLITTQQPD